MSLKAKISPYIFTFGLVLSLFSFNCYAYPNGDVRLPVELLTEDYMGQIYYSFHTDVPSNYFSSSDCGYNPINQGMNIFTTGLTDVNGNSFNFGGFSSTVSLSSIQSSGEFRAFTPISSTGPLSSFPTGNYYLPIQGNSGGYPCNTYLDYVFHWDLNTQTLSIGSITPPEVDGVCGSDYLQTLTSTPTNLCSSGTSGTVFWNPIEQIWLWSCSGSGGGANTSCHAYLSSLTPMDGVCGPDNGQTLTSTPTNLCSGGLPDSNVYTTLTGWTWTCWGINNGVNVGCSTTNGTPEIYPTPPDTNPVPTPTDCNTETGLNQIVCNITNTIEGMFFPSQSKLVEFQKTINQVNNVFPFNYLSVIGNTFKGLNVTDGGLTVTLLGNTSTLSEDFYDIPLVAILKKGFTIMVYLAFVAWAIGYIKNFFK